MSRACCSEIGRNGGGIAICGQTNHAYNESIACEVVDAIPGFLKEVQYLHQQLVQRLSK